MDDLIRRKDALRPFTISWKGERIPETDIDNFPTQISFRDVKKILREVPSAKPKSGIWRHYEGMLTCSECGTEYYDDIMEYTGDKAPKFCPECGAKMW